MAAQHVMPGITADRVIARQPEQPVVARTARDEIRTRAAPDHILSAPAEVIAPDGRGRIRRLDLGRVQRRQVVMRDRKDVVAEIRRAKRAAIPGKNVDHRLVIEDLDAIALRREGQLPDAADHAQLRQVQPVCAGLEVAHRDAALDIGGDEDIRAGAADQRDGFGGGDQDVVTLAPAHPCGAGARQHQVVAAGPGGRAAGGNAGKADGAGIEQQLRHPGLGPAGHEQHDPAIHHLRLDRRHIGQRHRIGIGDRGQVQQPPVGLDGKDADPVIAPARKDEGAAIHYRRRQRRHRLEPGL